MGREYYEFFYLPLSLSYERLLCSLFLLLFIISRPISISIIIITIISDVIIHLNIR